MIYILTEWDGKGSGNEGLRTYDKSEAMNHRECTLTQKAAEQKYGSDFLRCLDIKCSSIDSYKSEKELKEGKPVTSSTWY